MSKVPKTVYKVRLSASAVHSIEHVLPRKVSDAALTFILGPLRENPRRVGKPLIGPYKNAFSARRGEYRIVYEIIDDEILIEITKIAHRAKAYYRSYK
jgi:mRNA interferase RelE/StbE